MSLRRAAIGAWHLTIGSGAGGALRAIGGRRTIPSHPARVVVLALQKIGDAVTVEPAVRMLRARFPGARLVGGGAASRERGPDMGAVEVLRLMEALDEVVPVRRWRDLRALRGDLVVSFGLRARDAWAGVAARGPAGTSVGYTWEGRGAAFDVRVPAPWQVMRTAAELGDRGTPQHELWCDLVRTTVGGGSTGVPRLRVPDLARADAEALLREREVRAGFVALAPWNGQAHFRWPEERWVALGRAVGRDVVVLGGRARDEVAHATRLVEALREAGVRATSFAGLWGIDRDAGILERAGVVVGVDSGPVHVARAVGARTVVVFGPGTPRVWAPPGAVAVQRTEGCHGCRQRRCTLSRRECLEDLPVERVAALCGA